MELNTIPTKRHNSTHPKNTQHHALLFNAWHISPPLGHRPRLHFRRNRLLDSRRRPAHIPMAMQQRPQIRLLPTIHSRPLSHRLCRRTLALELRPSLKTLPRSLPTTNHPIRHYRLQWQLFSRLIKNHSITHTRHHTINKNLGILQIPRFFIPTKAQLPTINLS